MQRVGVVSRHLGTSTCILQSSSAAAGLPAKSASGQAAAAEVRNLLCTGPCDQPLIYDETDSEPVKHH
jgi:hypothetical protein